MTRAESCVPAVIGGYCIAEVIGAGGQSEVFAIAAETGGPSRVIKWSREAYDPPWTDPLAAEYRTLSTLCHPQLVAPYDFGYHDGRAYMVNDLIDGPALFDGLTQNKEESIGALMQTVSPVISFLHRRGIIHRDLKPANFRWSSSPEGAPRLYLLDLGLVSRPRDPAAEGRAGTLYYMAPEVLREGRADARSDLYSLGVMLFEWLTGAPPFAGPDPADIINGHLSAEIRWPANLPESINEQITTAIGCLLKKDPDDRPGNIEETIALFAEAGIPLDVSFSELQNIPWHQKTTRRDFPQIDCPIELSTPLKRRISVHLAGDHGSGAPDVLSRWERELKICGWAVKSEGQIRQANHPGSADTALAFEVSNDPVSSEWSNADSKTGCCLVVRPLTRKPVAEYLNNIFFDVEFVQEILPVMVQLSSGLPEAIDIILTEWIGSDIINFRDGSWSVDTGRLHEVTGNEDLRGLYGEIVGELTAIERRCLGYAACCGPEFSTQALQRLLRENGIPDDVILALSDRGMFIPFADSDEPLVDARFRLSGLGEIWAADLPPEHRTDLHGAIAAVLDDWGETWGAKISRRLAHHYYASNQFRPACEKALIWAEYNATAEGAAEAHRYLDLAETAVEHVERGPVHDELAASVSLLRGRVHNASGMIEQAQVCFRRVLALTRRSGDLRRRAEAAKTLGDTYKSTRQHAKGGRILRIALRDFQQLGDEIEVSHTLNNLGNISYNRGLADEALDYYQRALTIQRKHDLKVVMASTLSNLASVYVQKYELKQAQTYLGESLRLKEALHQPVEVARTLNNLGVVGVVAGQLEEAADYIVRATEINRRVGANSEWLLNRANLLEIWTFQAQYRQATDEAQELLCRCEELEEYVLRVYIHVTLARADHEIANYSLSAQHLGSAESLFDKVDQPSTAKNYYILQSERCLLFGDREGCRSALRQALEYARKSGDPRESAEVYLAAAKAEEHIGEISPEFFAPGEEAYRLFDKYAGRHRIFELLLATDDQALTVFLSEFPLPDNFAGSPVIDYTGPPGQNGWWLWRLAQKALAEGDNDLAQRLLAALVLWSEEHGVAELLWRARAELGILYHRAHDWELAAGSFSGAVRQLGAIAEKIDSPDDREAYMSGPEIKRLNQQVAEFSELFANR